VVFVTSPLSTQY